MTDKTEARTSTTLFVDGPSARFGYRRIGSGTGVPLILLNRFAGTLDWWDSDFLARLAAGREVILVDNVGIGYTTGTPRDTVQAMADGAIEFLDLLELRGVDLLGWSLGGMVAQHVALKRPDLVRKLVVAASTPGGQAPDAPPPSPRAGAIMAKPEPTPEDLVALLFGDTDIGREHGARHVADVVSRLTESSAPLSPEARTAGMAAILGFGATPLDVVRENLRAASHPVLYAAAATDELIPAAASAFAVRTIADDPGSTEAVLLTYSSGGHGFLFEHTASFTSFVGAFLDD